MKELFTKFNSEVVIHFPPWTITMALALGFYENIAILSEEQPWKMLQIHAFDPNDRKKFAKDTVSIKNLKNWPILLEIQVGYFSFWWGHSIQDVNEIKLCA